MNANPAKDRRLKLDGNGTLWPDYTYLVPIIHPLRFAPEPTVAEQYAMAVDGYRPLPPPGPDTKRCIDVLVRERSWYEQDRLLFCRCASVWVLPSRWSAPGRSDRQVGYTELKVLSGLSYSGAWPAEVERVIRAGIYGAR